MTALAPGLAVLLVVLFMWPRRPFARRASAPAADSPRGRRVLVVDQRTSHVLLASVAASIGFLVSGPVVAVVAGGGALLVRQVLGRIQDRRRRAVIAGAVPDLVDLFLVSASAGQPVASSLAVVAPRCPTVVGSFVGAAAGRFDGGLPLAECLEGLGSDLGPAGRPLADALRQAAATGVPLVPLLEGVAATVRDQRRRRAQEVARRLPVTMLLPLVACTLPAAVLLAVVPVLLVSVASLSP